MITKSQEVLTGQNNHKTDQNVAYNPESKRLMVNHGKHAMALSTENWDNLVRLVKEVREVKERYEVFATIDIPENAKEISTLLIIKKGMTSGIIEVVKLINQPTPFYKEEQQHQRKLWENYAQQTYEAIIIR